MKYYRINKEKGIIELIDSETNKVKVATTKKVEVKKPELPKQENNTPVVNDEKITIDEQQNNENKQVIVEEPIEVQDAVKEEKPKNLKIIVISVICTLFVVGAIGAIYLATKSFSSDVATKEETINDSEKQTEDKQTDIKETWKTNKAINEDYIGQLVFESGLINQPVVQGADNEEYFRTNWKDMSHDEEGSCFMDYRNEPDDQNLIVYGHYVYPSYEKDTLGRTEALGDRMFTPLAKLVDKSNYEKNKYVDLYLENEVIRYQVAVVFHCILDAEQDYVVPIENMYYCITNYDEEYFETYKKAIYENAFYDTGVDINYNDKLLTLQTCVEGHDELLEIVVCKEISRKAY